jgi:hypothetical protein
LKLEGKTFAATRPRANDPSKGAAPSGSERAIPGVFFLSKPQPHRYQESRAPILAENVARGGIEEGQEETETRITRVGDYCGTFFCRRTGVRVKNATAVVGSGLPFVECGMAPWKVPSDQNRRREEGGRQSADRKAPVPYLVQSACVPNINSMETAGRDTAKPPAILRSAIC